MWGFNLERLPESPTCPNLNRDASAKTAQNAMELKNLSSNWRKLQSTLNEEPKAQKRRTVDALRPLENGRKRLKTMGSSTLKHAEPAPKSLTLWAQDNGIPAADLVQAYGKANNASLHDAQHASERVNEGLSAIGEAGKYIAVDCEMVGVGPDPDNDSALARVSIVNYHGHQLYDSFVLPKEPVTDYRTFVSGITPHLLETARTLDVVQADVASLLDGRILIGHSVRNDLDALLLGHPKRDIRDTSRYPGFRQYSAGKHITNSVYPRMEQY